MSSIISGICFQEKTPIQTDQGIILVEMTILLTKR
jgi:hypothetical protein